MQVVDRRSSVAEDAPALPFDRDEAIRELDEMIVELDVQAASADAVAMAQQGIGYTERGLRMGKAERARDRLRILHAIRTHLATE